MAAVPRYDKVRDALIEGLDNLAKWYKRLMTAQPTSSA
jgi:hypothetical protein